MGSGYFEIQNFGNQFGFQPALYFGVNGHVYAPKFAQNRAQGQ
jgi:hypothetical protein